MKQITTQQKFDALGSAITEPVEIICEITLSRNVELKAEREK